MYIRCPMKTCPKKFLQVLYDNILNVLKLWNTPLEYSLNSKPLISYTTDPKHTLSEG
jgi:hypothetical protein